MQVKNYKDAVETAEKMLSNCTKVIFVDNGNEETFSLSNGIWKGTGKQFLSVKFAHVVAGFWMIHKGNRNFYTLSM